MIIGIDLGTTYSGMAFLNANGEPEMLANNEGERLTPSVVSEDCGKIIVGTEAKESSVLMGSSAVVAAKNYMGTDKTFMLGSESYRAEGISAFILKKLAQDASKALGQTVDKAVVTVPAYFTDAQRLATRQAGEIAGLDITVMPNEPTAAALYYAWSNNIKSGNIMIYDLGGGTFDVSIVRIDGSDAQVVATGGLRKLGGHFFDQKIITYVADYLLEKYNIDIYEDEYIDELQDITNKAEKCKISLSSRETAAINVRIGKVRESIEITRAQFEKMIARFYSRTESVCMDVLDDAKMSWRDIDKLVLVGGSSLIPMVTARMDALSGLVSTHGRNANEAVALGAALYTGGFFDKVVDVCSHSLGIITKDQMSGNRKNSIILPRNTELPAQSRRGFVIPRDNFPKIVMEITEGEDTDPEFVNVLTTLIVDLPAGVKAGTRVEVEMILNDEQLLEVNAYIMLDPVIKKKINVPRKNNLDADKVSEASMRVQGKVIH